MLHQSMACFLRPSQIMKYVAACLAVFAIFGTVDVVFDISVLASINHSLLHIWRPSTMRWLEPAMYLVSSLVFVFLIMRMQRPSVSRGILYGALFGILMGGVNAFRQYANYPIPLVLAVLWFIEGLIQYAAAGLATVLICRPRGVSKKG
jgi:hypothetical protein